MPTKYHLAVNVSNIDLLPVGVVVVKLCHEHKKIDHDHRIHILITF
jgi:hypothetical protein